MNSLSVDHVIYYVGCSEGSRFQGFGLLSFFFLHGSLKSAH